MDEYDEKVMVEMAKNLASDMWIHHSINRGTYIKALERLDKIIDKLMEVRDG